MSFQAVWWILGRKEEDGHSFICPLHEILLWKPAEHWALFLCSSAGLFLLSWGHFLCPPLRALGFFGGILPAAEPARVRPPGLRVLLLERGAMSHFLESFKEHMDAESGF